MVTAVATRAGAEVHRRHRRLLRRRQLRDVRPRLLAAVPVDVAQRPHLGDGRRAGGDVVDRRRDRLEAAARTGRRDEERSRRRSASSTSTRATRTTRPPGCGTTASSTRADTRTVLGLALSACANAPLDRPALRRLPDVRATMFDTVLVANRGEIAVASSAPCAARASARSPSTPTPTRDALHVRRPTSPSLGPASRARATSIERAIVAAARATGAEAVHPGYGFLSENADFAARLRRRRARLHRPAAPTAIEVDGRQDPRPRRPWSRPACPWCPGRRRPGMPDDDADRRRRPRDRLPGADQAVGRRRRQGHARRRRRRRATRRAVAAARREARGVVRRRHPVPRALRRPPAPHRDAGARRRARQRRPPRRARVLACSAATRRSSRRRRRRCSTPRRARRMGAAAVEAARAVRLRRRRHGRVHRLRRTPTRASSSSSR